MRLALLVLVVLAGCGHAYRGTAGPTIASGGRGGAELGVEIGTHLLSSNVVSMPISVRAQTIVLSDGSVEGMFGITGALWTVPGWRIDREEDEQTGWSMRLGSTGGVALGDQVGAWAARGAFGVAHGRVRHIGSSSGGCKGSEKSDPILCLRWDRWHARGYGAEVALTQVFEDRREWRITGAFAIEDVTMSDLSLR